MLYDKLRADLTIARKNKDKEKVNTLSYIVGSLVSNAEMINGDKVVKDSAVNSFLKKYIENNEYTIRVYNQLSNLNETELGDRDIIARQNDIARAYLPSTLSETELNEIIDNALAENPNIGYVMGVLRNKYDSRYDGKVASSIVKNRLEALKGNE